MTGFFDLPPPAPKPPEPVHRPPPWAKPEDIIPSVAALDVLLVLTDDVAVALCSFVVYPNGFEVVVNSYSREPPPNRVRHAHAHLLNPFEPPPPEFLRFGLVCADGTKATNLPVDRATWESSGRILHPGDSSSGQRSSESRHWCSPLPPPGPIRFVCEWPAFAIPETAVEVDSAPILDAAARCRRLWDG